MNSTDRQVNRSPGYSALDKVWLAPWALYDLSIFGVPLIAVIVGLLATGKPLCWLAIVPLVLLIWLISFFRNPPRKIPDDPRAIVGPADGTVVDITPLAHYEFIGGPAIRIGIFLSIFNVHINRAPLSGRVVELHYHPGEFLNALRPESAERNEFMWIGFEQTEPPLRRFAVRQISGMLARRIVCTLEPGQTVTRGEKFGMIKLGSRTELILPAEAVEITVQPGDVVHAGSHILARWKQSPEHLSK
jgi:phosphatidylserine decarboxylase